MRQDLRHLAVLTLALGAAVGVTRCRVPATFSVVLNTERIAFVSGSEPSSRWVLDGVWITRDYGARERFRGALELADSVEVVVKRISTGPVQVRIEALGGPTAGRLWNTADEPVGLAGKVLEIEVDSVSQRAATGRSTVFPLTGHVESGNPLGFITEPDAPILRSGQVDLLGRSLLGEDVFAAGSQGLGAGDWFTVDAPQGPASGFIAADERPGLNGAYRVRGTSGQVVRPGGEVVPVSVPVRARLMADPLVQAAWATFLIVLGFRRFLPRPAPRKPGRPR